MSLRDHMKRQMRQMVAQLGDIRVTESANWKTCMMLRDALIRNDIPPKVAEMIAVRMKVDVDEDLFNEDPALISEMVNGMAVGFGRLYNGLCTELRHMTADDAILELSRQFDIKLNF